MTAPRQIVNVLAALVLAGILAYLYLRTEVVDFRNHAELSSSLLRLREVDSGWNRDAYQRRLRPGEGTQSSAGSLQLAQQTLSALSSQLGPDYGQDLRLGVESLERDFDAKGRLLERLNALPAGDAEADRIAEQILVLPIGSRIDTLMGLLNRHLERLSVGKEVYRTYLIYYAAALLVLLAWVGSRLVHTNQLLIEANRALKKANEELEHRVQDRTRELSEALRHLQESETMLIQSEKMSSLGQMVAGIAHEINTPLAYVKASLQSVEGELPHVRALVQEADALLRMLSAGEPDEDRLAAQFQRAADAAQRFSDHQGMGDLEHLVKDGLHGIGEISELVLSLKNFSRLDRSRLARFNLNEGVESALVIARNMIKTKTVKKSLGEIPSISCVPSQINQVFLNLITNAAQATPDNGGVISVTTRTEGADRVVMEVADNGHGIPPEILPRIFDPFFTTKEVGRGTGLGLSIAYKIVEHHGGVIKVDSRPGAGSRFTVVLPLEPPATAS